MCSAPLAAEGSEKRLGTSDIYSTATARRQSGAPERIRGKEQANMTTHLLIDLAKQLPYVIVIVTTFVVVMSKTADKEGFFHWTARASHDTRRGLGDLLQSAGSDVTKSLFTSARIGTSHICGSMAGRDEICIAFNVFVCIAAAILFFFLLSLAFCVAVAVMASPPRFLQQALGGQLKTGVAWVGAAVTLIFSIFGLAMDAYFWYRGRRMPTPQEGEARFADERDVRGVQDGGGYAS
ncbi:hypothetical protein ACQRIU_007023 [Beauveria bassiana]